MFWKKKYLDKGEKQEEQVFHIGKKYGMYETGISTSLTSKYGLRFVLVVFLLEFLVKNIRNR